MHSPHLNRLFALPVVALLAVACSSAGGPGWTYAPLGPTAAPASDAPATAAPSGAPSPDGSADPGTTIEVSTPQDDPLAFVPPELEMPAGASVTVNYLNDSSLPHNINFFDGPDQSASSLGATEVVTGPDALESVTFTAPAEPGDYLFWCDVHGTAMQGIYHVQ